MLATAERTTMAKKKAAAASESRKHSAMIRVEPEAHERAAIAASLMRVSLGDYASRILTEAADRDIAREAAKLTKPPKGKAPKGETDQ